MKIITEREKGKENYDNTGQYIGRYIAYFEDFPEVHFLSRTEGQAIRRLLEFRGSLKGIKLERKWMRAKR